MQMLNAHANHVTWPRMVDMSAQPLPGTEFWVHAYKMNLCICICTFTHTRVRMHTQNKMSLTFVLTRSFCLFYHSSVWIWLAL